MLGGEHNFSSPEYFADILALCASCANLSVPKHTSAQRVEVPPNRSTAKAKILGEGSVHLLLGHY